MLKWEKILLWLPRQEFPDRQSREELHVWRTGGTGRTFKNCQRNKDRSTRGILGDVKEENTAIIGSPAIEVKQFLRSSVIFKKLPEMKVKIDSLEKEIESLKKK